MQLYHSATNFSKVVDSFNVFLGSFMGIMFAEYFLIRERTMKLTDLFDASAHKSMELASCHCVAL